MISKGAFKIVETKDKIVETKEDGFLIQFEDKNNHWAVIGGLDSLEKAKEFIDETTK